MDKRIIKIGLSLIGVLLILVSGLAIADDQQLIELPDIGSMTAYPTINPTYEPGETITIEYTYKNTWSYSYDFKSVFELKDSNGNVWATDSYEFYLPSLYWSTITTTLNAPSVEGSYPFTVTTYIELTDGRWTKENTYSNTIVVEDSTPDEPIEDPISDDPEEDDDSEPIIIDQQSPNPTPILQNPWSYVLMFGIVFSLAPFLFIKD